MNALSLFLLHRNDLHIPELKTAEVEAHHDAVDALLVFDACYFDVI